MKKKHKNHQHEEHIDESWLIPYADLLTLLLALFIVLFSLSSVDAKKYEQMSQAFSIAFNGGTGVLQNDGTTPLPMPSSPSQTQTSGNQTERQAQMRQEQEDMEKLKQQLDQYIKDNNLTTQLDTKLNHSNLLITISDNALFDSGSAEVKTNARDLGINISTMLQQYPTYEIVVAGHTDNLPINNWLYRSNWDLSSDRAINFMKVLLENPGLEPKRFSAVGFGEYRPVDKNDTVDGRSKNRRVEVSILRKFTDPTPADGTSAQ